MGRPCATLTMKNKPSRNQSSPFQRRAGVWEIVHRDAPIDWARLDLPTSAGGLAPILPPEGQCAMTNLIHQWELRTLGGVALRLFEVESPSPGAGEFASAPPAML